MCSVTVFGVEGETLAPCHPARARQLLKAKRAVVKSIQPYSIRLLSRSGGNPCNHKISPSNSINPAGPFHGKAGNRQAKEVIQ